MFSTASVKIIFDLLIIIKLAICSPFSAIDKNLKMQLFANYSKTTSPDEMVEVNIELVSFYLIDIDEKKQIMTSYSIINQKWNDSRLSWNSSMYNLTKVSLTLDSIWKPSTIVTNSAL